MGTVALGRSISVVPRACSQTTVCGLFSPITICAGPSMSSIIQSCDELFTDDRPAPEPCDRYGTGAWEPTSDATSL